MQAPCYNCKERELGCHSSCTKYAEFKKHTEKARLKQREDTMLNGHIKLTQNRFSGKTLGEM